MVFDSTLHETFAQHGKITLFFASAPVLHINQKRRSSIGRCMWRKTWMVWDKNGMEISMSIESIAIEANLFCHPMSQVQSEVLPKIWSSETQFHSENESAFFFFAAVTHGIAHFYKNICSYVSIYFGWMFILFIILFLFLLSLTFHSAEVKLLLLRRYFCFGFSYALHLFFWSEILIYWKALDIIKSYISRSCVT